MTDEKQAKSIKTFRPWVGIVLSFFIAGASQFLTGKKLIGVGWFLIIELLSLAAYFCLASPSVPGNTPGFALLAVAVVLWIIMLIKSYRPVPRFRWIGWVYFVFLFLILSTISGFEEKIVRPFRVPTFSMSPTLQGNRRLPDGTTTSGDRIFIEGCAYWFHKPQRGDIIVFETKGISESQRERYHIPPDEFYVKRIVGVPGDVLSVQNGHLYNDGQILSKPLGLAKLQFTTPIANPIYLTNSLDAYKVPDGSYFVVGDNTTNSLDSRYYGTISKKNIVGRVSKIYWPLNRAGKIE